MGGEGGGVQFNLQLCVHTITLNTDKDTCPFQALEDHFAASLSSASPPGSVSLRERSLPPSFWDSSWQPREEASYHPEHYSGQLASLAVVNRVTQCNIQSLTMRVIS